MIAMNYENSHEAKGLENIGWKFTPHKRVSLKLDATTTKFDKATISQTLGHSLGHFEWEEWTSRLVANAIKTAVSEGKTEADITPLFQCDLVGWDASGEYVKKANKLEQQLKERLFDVIDEDDDELQLKFKNI